MCLSLLSEVNPFLQSRLPHKFLFVNLYHQQNDNHVNAVNSTTPNMSNTVHVKGIGSETSEKEVRDFFSFW